MRLLIVKCSLPLVPAHLKATGSGDGAISDMAVHLLDVNGNDMRVDILIGVPHLLYFFLLLVLMIGIMTSSGWRIKLSS